MNMCSNSTMMVLPWTDFNIGAARELAQHHIRSNATNSRQGGGGGGARLETQSTIGGRPDIEHRAVQRERGLSQKQYKYLPCSISCVLQSLDIKWMLVLLDT